MSNESLMQPQSGGPGNAMPIRALIALGSNQGDRQALMQQAVQRLAAHPEVELLAVSSLYETDPVDFTDQPPFLNAVVQIATTLQPLALLDVCQQIENELGRVRQIRYGPRTMDLDLLTYGELVLNHQRLTLPHPRMAERDFVQIPCAEIREGLQQQTDAVRLFQRDWLQSGDLPTPLVP